MIMSSHNDEVNGVNGTFQSQEGASPGTDPRAEQYWTWPATLNCCKKPAYWEVREFLEGFWTCEFVYIRTFLACREKYSAS